jgi:hypothetical protein
VTDFHFTTGVYHLCLIAQISAVVRFPGKIPDSQDTRVEITVVCHGDDLDTQSRDGHQSFELESSHWKDSHGMDEHTTHTLW